MKSSSAIRLLVFCLVINLFTGCAFFKKTSKPEKLYLTEFREPAFVVTFAEVSEDEREKIIKEISTWNQARALQPFELNTGENFGFQIELDTENSKAIADLLKNVLYCHKKIMKIGTKENKKILGGESLTLRLGYISARAIARTSARFEVIPEPQEAKIYIETAIPALENYKYEDGSIILNSNDGRRFQIILPFSFIMENPYIFFITKYKNITRYFYYDLKSETRKELASEADYKYFKKHGELPPRD